MRDAVAPCLLVKCVVLLNRSCVASVYRTSKYSRVTEELRRAYIGLKGPIGPVDNPRIRIVYCDICLRPRRGNQEQGDQRREEYQGEHRRGERERGRVARDILCEWSTGSDKTTRTWFVSPAAKCRQTKGLGLFGR